MAGTTAPPAGVDTDSTEQQIKRRAACDECRLKKLKCTGEHPACSRCVRERINCVYSPQKQMGRPKKRQRTEDDVLNHAPNGYGEKEQDAGLNMSMYDINGHQSTFIPGLGLQPWLPNSTDWPDLAMADSHSSEGRMPSLVADSPSNSPPMLNLPPELQSNHNHCSSTTTPSQPDSTSLLLDPSLNGANLGLPPGLLPNCACLSTLYLTLNNLSSMDPTFTFPFALHPLREAMSTAANVLTCEECPTRFISAIHNTQLLGTLLMSIAERFSKVLEHITAESIRAQLAGESKKFRLADLNTSTSHLHTGGLSCAAAFSLDLSPEEWRIMCKKVVRAEVHGPAEGNSCCPYFMQITQQMHDRQERWHKGPVPDDFPRDSHGELLGRGPKHDVKKDDHVCLRLVAYANKLVEGFDWS